MDRIVVPDRIVVVVPAHDEERLISGALRALQAAAARVRDRVEVTVVVVANGCTDDTAARARAMGATVIEVPTANVGAARAVGCAWAVDRSDGHLDGLWLATTDADSRVGGGWLDAQVDAAADGADLYLGTVTLSPADRRTFAAWVSDYASSFEAPGRHGHVHGASMGMRAQAYVQSGGFRALPCSEDVDLVDRFMAARARIVWDEARPVVTSARLAARAPSGVARDLELSLEPCEEAV